MKFWDSSAIVPFLVRDQMTRSLYNIYQQDIKIVVWWGTEIECVSAISRLEREKKLSLNSATEALSRLKELRAEWYEIQPVDALRETAKRMLRVHVLCAADSLQLAAALIASENKPSTLDFACLDNRLAAAAQKEGFNVIHV